MAAHTAIASRAPCHTAPGAAPRPAWSQPRQQQLLSGRRHRHAPLGAANITSAAASAPSAPLAPVGCHLAPSAPSPSPPLPYSPASPLAAGPTSAATAIRRRSLLLASAAALVAAAAVPAALPRPAVAVALGPLGPVRRVGGDKRTGLTSEEVAAVLRRDLAEGQYFVTGDLTPEIFEDDCRFVDPTNDVAGLSKYLTALGVLFDPQFSKVQLLSIRASGPRTVEADWRLGGYLVFPWNPKVEPFEGHTVYTLSEAGLVAEQRQTWSISGGKALADSFTPTFGPKRQLF